MLCSRPRPLNASATVAGLPDAQRERPSRAAGSFCGQVRSFMNAHSDDHSWHKAVYQPSNTQQSTGTSDKAQAIGSGAWRDASLFQPLLPLSRPEHFRRPGPLQSRLAWNRS